MSANNLIGLMSDDMFSGLPSAVTQDSSHDSSRVARLNSIIDIIVFACILV